MLTALCLLIVGTLIFRDFFFGNAVLLYKDIGSDSLIDYYPWFVHFSDYLRNEGFPSWSFAVGMGQDIFYLAGYLLLDPVTWLPKGLIAPALVYQHLAKILVAGLLFFRFLRLREFGAARLAAGFAPSLFFRLHDAWAAAGISWPTKSSASPRCLLAAEEAINRRALVPCHPRRRAWSVSWVRSSSTWRVAAALLRARKILRTIWMATSPSPPHLSDAGRRGRSGPRCWRLHNRAEFHRDPEQPARFRDGLGSCQA